ncbi:hypothetical protein SUGI_0277460 [Cryptomeria japonica]|uniref:probable inositol oxygenase n=1 Tax=Cryptomeria japonica TaxID=3369 RepID=UPI002408AA38|nr:probable inositol oxygenase [Cryptomeria japonica]GLJ16368.1 hypothetical protein SUGI_0277460 [Cryptomeria japonica]
MEMPILPVHSHHCDEGGQELGFVVPESNAFGKDFRSYYTEGERKSVVEETYHKNHAYQTFELVQRMREKHLCFNKGEMGIWECAELLNDIVDESDPDLDMPQIEHLLQTAEAIRKDYPDQDWFHLTAFIHDLGKVLLHPKFGQSPQWAVVGDTFPVGCPFDKSIVHHQMFLNNPDTWDPKYNTGTGIYQEGCGFEKLFMSWGHDDYMYQVMKENKSTLPPQAYFVIHYHSFYVMHQEGAYMHFMNDLDRQMLPWLQEFNKYDLYSKSTVCTDVEKLKPYYQSLIHKYFPEKLRW